MDISGKVCVVTGAAGGIGLAVAKAMKAAGAKVVISDLDAARLDAAARSIGALSVQCDVTREEQVQSLVTQVEAKLGPVDLFLSNAGLGRPEPTHAASAGNDVWQLCWDIHVMAHVYAARAVLPGMIERGSGYLINTASAAGLLNQIGDAAYSATKHAAVSFAESLAISHGDDGIRVSVICPQYVATPLLGFDDPSQAELSRTLISPDDVADAVMHGIDSEAFLILPHPDVSEFYAFRAANPDHWLGGMRKLRRIIISETGELALSEMHKMI